MTSIEEARERLTEIAELSDRMVRDDDYIQLRKKWANETAEAIRTLLDTLSQAKGVIERAYGLTTL